MTVGISKTDVRKRLEQMLNVTYSKQNQKMDAAFRVKYIPLVFCEQVSLVNMCF